MIYSRATWALRGPAWRCHVALRATSHPRGPRAPFFNFYLFILLFKIENKIGKTVLKIRKNPLKIENS